LEEISAEKIEILPDGIDVSKFLGYIIEKERARHWSFPESFVTTGVVNAWSLEAEGGLICTIENSN